MTIRASVFPSREGIIDTHTPRHARALRCRPRTRGLTLVELLVVITIIGLVMSAIGIAAFHFMRQAQIDTTRIACERLRTAAQAYAITHPDESDCPTAATLQAARVLDSTTSLTDPWGTLYKIECTPDEVTATSAGPDRAFGNADDIRVPGPRRRPAGVATQP